MPIIAQRTHAHIAGLVLAAVFVVFAGAGLLKMQVWHVDDHCMSGTCETTAPQSMTFCVSHCLSAAQAGHAAPTLPVTVGMILLAIGAVIAMPGHSRPSLTHSHPTDRQTLWPSLRIVHTVVLRE